MSTTVETNVVRLENVGQDSTPAENPVQSTQAAPEAAVAHPASAVLQAVVDELAAKNAWRKETLRCKANTDVVLVNIRLAAEALLKPEVEARLKKSLPDFDLARLHDAVRLAQALNYIDYRVDAYRPQMKKGTEDLILGRKLREQFASVVRMAVAFGYIPDTATKEMFKGNSKGNIGHDLNNSIHLLQTHAEKLKNVMPISPELMSKAEVLAGRMLMTRDIGSPWVEVGGVDVGEQIRIRDLLYTDLVDLHEQMRRAAFWLWGSAMDKYVPPLRSARRTKNAKGEEGKVTQPGQATAPAATTTPATVPAQPNVVLPFQTPAHANGPQGVPAVLTIEQPGTMTPKLIVA